MSKEIIDEFMREIRENKNEFRRKIIRRDDIDEDIKIEIDKMIINDNYEGLELYLDKINKKEKKKNKKDKIPAVIRRLVWDKYIGEEKGKGKCYCCEMIEISQMNFICGHVVSEFNGGKITIENLRPICVSCNLSMGTMDMNKFKNNYFS